MWNSGTLTWNSYLEPWLGTWEPLLATLTSNIQTFRNLLEPFWNLYLKHLETLDLKLWSLLEPSLRTHTWNLLKPLLGTSCIIYLEPWLGTLEPLRTLEPLLTKTWNLGTFRNLRLEPFVAWNLCFKPFTVTGNLGTSWILDLEPFQISRNPGTFRNPGSFTWNPYLEPRNLAGWLPQSATGPSLAETPKFSAFGFFLAQRLSCKKCLNISVPKACHTIGSSRFEQASCPLFIPSAPEPNGNLSPPCDWRAQPPSGMPK